MLSNQEINIFLSKSKIFKDVIHDSIEVTLVANSIIDTNVFQRLRNLHQLGVCYLVFSNANNNRLEHSIGTYHLAERLLNSLIVNSKPIEINKVLLDINYIRNYLLQKFELEDNETSINFLTNYSSILLDKYLIELVKIGGLVHDLGHGPFSHLFDEWLYNSPDCQQSCTPCSLKLCRRCHNDFIEHEHRSILLLDYIIEKTNITYKNNIYRLSDFINTDAFNFISELVNPTKNTPTNFIFQIISNTLNGLDVDKLDYLYRDSFYFGTGAPFDLLRIINHAQVIDSNISFPEKISYEIYKVYRTRYDLHKQFYNHKTVVCIEYMVRSILSRLDNILKITETIKTKNIKKFIELNDSVIFNTTSIMKQLSSDANLEMYQEDIIYIENILERIYSRKLYKCLYSEFFNVDEVIDVPTKINSVISKIKLTNSTFNKCPSEVNNFIIPILLKIGLLGGNKNHPFNNLYFYDKDQNSKILSKDKISHLMPTLFQERLLYIINAE
jgi:HD superfamily phosphohydrolase